MQIKDHAVRVLADFARKAAVRLPAFPHPRPPHNVIPSPITCWHFACARPPFVHALQCQATRRREGMPHGAVRLDVSRCSSNSRARRPGTGGRFSWRRASTSRTCRSWSRTRMLNTRGVSSFDDLNTNNTRVLARKACIVLYFIHGPPCI